MDKLLSMNNRLSTELMALIEAIEAQLQKVKENREKKIQQMRDREKPTAIATKDKELMGKQKNANKLQKEIAVLKRRLAGAHSDESSKQMENDLSIKLGIIAELESEISATKKVSKQQTKALHGLNSQGVSDDYVSKVKEMVSQHKAELKQLKEEYLIEDKQLKIEHKNRVELEEKCRIMESLLKNGKKKTKPAEPVKANRELDDEIEALRRDIEEIEQRELQELEYKKKILANVETRKQQLAHSVGLMNLKIKEKEQEEKLSDLKAKELQRSVPHRQLKPLRRNQSQSDRTSDTLQPNDSTISYKNGRNASASRIPSIRTQKKKNKKKMVMNMSVDAAPQTDKRSKADPPLLNSSEDEMPDEKSHPYGAISEQTKDEIKRNLGNGYKGYTPTGMAPGKLKAPLPPQH